MTRFDDRTCYPANEAPSVTHEVAKCQVCGIEWQVRSPNRDDARGCSFCGAHKDQITVVSEAPDYSGGLV